MGKIRVLQVTKLYHPWIGGVERAVQDIAEGLKDKVDMEVLACESCGRGRRELINGVRVTKAASLGIYRGMPLSITFPSLLAGMSNGADILHFHLPFPLAAVSHLLMRPPGKRVMITYHSDIVRQKKWLTVYGPFLHRFLHEADKIMPTSPNLMEHSEHLKCFKGKCVVVPLSVDLKIFSNRRRRSRERDFRTDRKMVLTVGRLNYYKGVEYLIEAMKHVDAMLVIAGDGERRSELEKRASTPGLREKVKFVGRVPSEELRHLYQCCDVFVLPSIETSEAFGLVQLEAMACGKPVVNTSLPTGVPYVSKHGETGLTVPPRDSLALAKAINTILLNEDLAARFGMNAVCRAREKFSREKMLASLYCLYEALALGRALSAQRVLALEDDTT